jgi:hypothetical protein
MLPRCAAIGVFLALAAIAAGAPVTVDVSGTWIFTHAGDHFQGRITLEQSGPAVTGRWHTSVGKTDEDQPLAGQVSGHTLSFTRFIGGGAKQTYVLAVSKSGDRIDGFGEGFFLNHTNLNMRRPLPPRVDLTGEWYFWHVGDRYQGTILLKQSESVVAGTWHTEIGKNDADSVLSGVLDGDTLYITRYIGSLQQEFVLGISAEGTQVRGFGEGWGINHANLDMRRRE